MEPRLDQSSQPLMKIWATGNGGRIRATKGDCPPSQYESDAMSRDPQPDIELDSLYPTTAFNHSSDSVVLGWDLRDRQGASNNSQASLVSEETQEGNGDAGLVRSGRLRHDGYGRIASTPRDFDEEPRGSRNAETHDNNVSLNNVPLATGVHAEEREDLQKRIQSPINEVSDWQPYTLRQPFLCLLTVSTVALLVILLSLQWYSITHHGIGSDNGSSLILLGWRFTPSVLAVLYVQMTAMLLNDVKRTEPLARMAKDGGGPAKHTIWKVPGAWWTALADGFSKKKNGGHWSWLLIAASITNIIGFLIISPLSASLLESTDILVTRAVEFLTLLPLARPPLPLSIGRETYLRVAGHLLQNTSTSAWITDNFYMVPFWPKDAPDMPVGPILEAEQRIWRAESMALTTDMECESLSLFNKMWYHVPVPHDDYGEYHASLLLESESGCFLNLTANVDIGIARSGGAVWTRTNNATLSEPYGSDQFAAGIEFSEGCEGHEIILISSPWGTGWSNFTFWSNFTSSGWTCRSLYYTATVESSVRTSDSPSTIHFSQSHYEKQRKLLKDDSLSVRQFESFAFESSWGAYLPRSSTANGNFYYGLCPMLAALYDFNFTAMMGDHDLLAKARAVKQRLFGEVLQYSILQNGSIQSKSFIGNIDAIERRVVLITGTSVTVMVLLVLELCLLLIIWSCVWKGRRPLNVRVDPSTATGAVSMIPVPIGGDPPTFKDFTRVIVDQTVSTGPNGLHLWHDVNDNLSKGSALNLKQDWRPAVLRLRTLGSLVLFLAALLTAIIVLYSFASKSLLYNTAFVYQTEISIFDHPMPAITPFPIVATLLSVGVSLWWGAVDVLFRRLQPFVSMASGPSAMAGGASLTYEGSYWLVAAWKSIENKHWMLCFITLGTSLTPIFTIAMSALFQRGQGNFISIHEAERQLELRRTPFIIDCPLCPRYSSKIASPVSTFVRRLYLGFATNWLYSAAIQLALNGSQPPWSKDGWSFVPLDFGRAIEVGLIQDLGASPFTPDVTVSLTTPAIRGRVECSGYEELADTSPWLTLANITMYYNISSIPNGLETAYQLGPSLSEGGTFFNTTYLVDGDTVGCCANESAQPEIGSSALGYWTADGPIYPSHGEYWPVLNSLWPITLTTKWIYGDSMIMFKGSELKAIYKEIPSVQALHCQPIIESAVANVTLDPQSGKVHSFSIIAKIVNATEAWNDAFVGYHGPNKQSVQPVERRSFSTVEANYTGLNYGVLFIEALLGSSHVDDRTFSFLDRSQGLNLDFMTFSMFAMANRDPTALLDASTMQRHAEKTFSTFFQHFVSSNLSATIPSWAYQEINASLPYGINSTSKYIPDEGYQSLPLPLPPQPPSHTNRTALVEVSTQVELLRMNAVAVWLSVAILAWLIFTTVAIAALQRKYLRNLDRNIECLGDVLVLVAHSDRLLQLVRERGPEGLEKERGVKTKLGWFEDGSGERRWGIEVVEEDG